MKVISTILGFLTILIATSCVSGSVMDPKFVRKRDANEHYEEAYDLEESSDDKKSKSQAIFF